MRKVLMLLLGFFVLCTNLWAQNRTITGKITDGKGAALANASVTVKGTNLGTTSNAEGNFTISVPSNSRTLVVSSIGMGTKEIAISGSETYSITLSSTTTDLQEVVVVGYGTQKRANLTGSVATVKAADIENKPFASVDQALQGRVAGLQSVAASGAPGANQQIRIRGISSVSAGNGPLYVIDGVPINANDLSRLTTTSNALATLNPNDIESVSVLKDAASQSIYGSRAANGVIVITTKKGRAGKTRFRVDVESGISDVAYVNEKYLPLNAAEYFQITREGLTNLGRTPAQIDATLASRGFGNGIDFNWYDAVTRKGMHNQANVSASGGTDKSTFFLSGGFFDQEGTAISTDLRRYTGSIRLTNKATERLSFNANINGGFNVQQTPLAGGAFGNPVLNAFFNIPSRSPYKPGTDSLNYNTTDFPNGGIYNPLAIAALDKRELRQTSLRGSIGGDYKIINNLIFRSTFGLDYNNLEEEQFNNPVYGDGYQADATDPTPAPFKRPDPANSGRSLAFYTRLANYVWTNTLNYRYDFTKLNLGVDVQAGYESQRSKTYQSSLTARGLPLNPNLTVPAAGATPNQATATFSEYAFVSQFATANVNYKEKYIVSGSFRRDGSSRFGPNNQYGNFWAVGLSWNVDRESFMENVKFVNQLKLRTSYGVNGNANIGNYDYFPGYGFGFNYNGATGSAPNNVGNLDLTWELNKPFNVGIDVSVLNSRINLTAEYYNRRSEDLLFNVPLSRTSGFASARRNIGEMENKGFELTINAMPVRTKNFNWEVDFNFALNRNKVLKLPNGDIANGSFLIREGYDVQTFFVREYAGVDPATGNPLWYTDSSRKATTGTLASAQRSMFGSASPREFGALTNKLSFKGFSIEAQLNYQFGNYVQDSWNSFTVGAGAGDGFGKVKRILDRWQKPGDVTDIPRIVAGGNNAFQNFSTFYLNRGDFVRLRNLQVGYELPKSLLSRANISNAFFYVRGANLYTWVKDKNLPVDPEQSTSSQSNLDVQIPRTITIGINLGF